MLLWLYFNLLWFVDGHVLWFTRCELRGLGLPRHKLCVINHMNTNVLKDLHND